jgi:hypothetical protein
VSFSTSCIFPLGTFPRHMSCFFIGIALHFSSSSSGKRVSSIIVCSSITSSFLYLTMISSSFSFGLLEIFFGSSSAFVRTLSSVSLTLFPGQRFFFFQGYLISIFHSSHCHHVDFILDFISRSIYVLGNLFFIILPMSFSYVHIVKFFGVLFY